VSTPRPVLLVRHGQSEWNALGRWQGIADPPLSDAGRSTADELAGSLAELVPSIDGVVWSSPLRRARDTAAIIAERLGLRVAIEERLAERSVGEWMGLTNREIDARWPGHREAGRWPVGFEPTTSVVARAVAALGDIAAASSERALVVAHAGIIRSLLSLHPGHDGPVPNLGGCWFDVMPSSDGTAPAVTATGRFATAPAGASDAGVQRL
jgi:broad specificity phosphatase PhoE